MRRFNGPPDSWYDPPDECDECHALDQDIKFMRDEIEELAQEIEDKEYELTVLRAGADISLAFVRGVVASLAGDNGPVIECVTNALDEHDMAMMHLLAEAMSKEDDNA